MSRYIREVKIDKPDDFVNYMVNDFIKKHGFQYVNFKGQMVYRAGGGLIELPKFMVWSYQNGVFHIEAWTRTVWFPGVYGRENALSGWAGAVPKGVYKKDVEQLVSLLFQALPNEQAGAQGADAAQTPAGMGQTGSQTIYVQGVDTSRYATMALGFGIAGLVLSWTWAGLIFGIGGIIYSVKGMSSSKKGMAIAGLVCSILGLVILVLIFVLSFFAGFLAAAA